MLSIALRLAVAGTAVFAINKAINKKIDNRIAAATQPATK